MECPGGTNPPQMTPFWKVDTPSYLLRGMVSILQLSFVFENEERQEKTFFFSFFNFQNFVTKSEVCKILTIPLIK